MKANDFRKKTVGELNKELEMRERELFNLRLQKAFGQAKPDAFRKARYAIACIKTVLHERA
ncbi:MAG: 50S ribosomal protein L29 [Gammaproteobacteria bacterium]